MITSGMCYVASTETIPNVLSVNGLIPDKLAENLKLLDFSGVSLPAQIFYIKFDFSDSQFNNSLVIMLITFKKSILWTGAAQDIVSLSQQEDP